MTINYRFICVNDTIVHAQNRRNKRGPVVCANGLHLPPWNYIPQAPLLRLRKTHNGPSRRWTEDAMHFSSISTNPVVQIRLYEETVETTFNNTVQPRIGSLGRQDE